MLPSELGLVVPPLPEFIERNGHGLGPFMLDSADHKTDLLPRE